MNVAIYCGSSFGNDKIYEESTKLLAQKLAENNLNIVCVGGGKFTEEELALFNKFNYENKVHHVSNIDNYELNSLYNHALALLFPSSYEGFGIPIIEAMKTKCPVIAFKNSSIPEVAGEAALLYEEENVDSIIHGIQKLQDKDLRDRLKNKGIIQAEKFSWDNTFRQYIEFYKELYDSEN